MKLPIIAFVVVKSNYLPEEMNEATQTSFGIGCLQAKVRV
jgi:hypothetical protein